MPSRSQNPALESIATDLKGILDGLFQSKGIVYTHDIEMGERELIEYESRMRVNGMEKFNSPCFIGVVQYYRNEQDKQAAKALGALILYVETDSADKLLKQLGYPVKLEADDEILLETTGKMALDAAKKLLEKLESQGYRGLVLSDPKTYTNTVPEGVEFDYGEYSYYEMTFHAWKQRIVSADITIGAV